MLRVVSISNDIMQKTGYLLITTSINNLTVNGSHAVFNLTDLILKLSFDYLVPRTPNRSRGALSLVWNLIDVFGSSLY